MGQVYGYIRCSHQQSTDSQLGLAVQEQQVAAYYHYGVVTKTFAGASFAGCFRDETVSAYKKTFLQRPAGRQLDAMLTSGDHLVFAKLDRGFRDARDCLSMIEYWRRRGIAIHFVDFKIDVNTAMGQLMVQLLAAFAQWDSAVKSERQRECKQLLRAQGKSVNGHKPPGFIEKRRKDGTKYSIPDPPEQQLMGELLALRDHGYSFQRCYAYAIQHYHPRRWSRRRLETIHKAALELEPLGVITRREPAFIQAIRQGHHVQGEAALASSGDWRKALRHIASQRRHLTSEVLVAGGQPGAAAPARLPVNVPLAAQDQERVIEGAVAVGPDQLLDLGAAGGDPVLVVVQPNGVQDLPLADAQ